MLQPLNTTIILRDDNKKKKASKFKGICQLNLLNRITEGIYNKWMNGNETLVVVGIAQASFRYIN